MSITYQIVYWRDIPAQVKVRSGDQRINRPLSPRFQEAIDDAAMRAQATSTDDYLSDWHSSEWQEGQGDADQLADALVTRLETEFDAERLRALKTNEGYQKKED